MDNAVDMFYAIKMTNSWQIRDQEQYKTVFT